MSRAAAYIPQRQEDGLQFYAGAAYATYRQNGTLWVTNLRTGDTHDTGVSADAPYHICTVGEDIALPYPFLILTAEPPSCGGSLCHAFPLYSACSMAASRSSYSSKAGYWG